jgi:hypothetical protein
LTSISAINILERVQTDILDLEVGSTLSLALGQAGVLDILDLMSLSFGDIADLTYVPALAPEGQPHLAPVAIQISPRNRVRLFKAWICALVEQLGGTELPLKKWNELRQGGF